VKLLEKSLNANIIIKENLTSKYYSDISDLERICREKDKIALKLELDYKINRSKSSSNELKVNNEFMYYQDQVLVGYIGILQFEKNDMEINGMVHPDYRRRGVFSELYGQVLQEFNKRTVDRMLLLTDHNSLSGVKFVKNTNALYENSEYEMFLNNIVSERKESTRIALRQATNKDAREIAIQNALYFNDTFDENQITLLENEENEGYDIFVAELDSKVIGKINLEVNRGIGGIYGFGVRPEYRGMGYGREILMKSIKKLKEENSNKIMLQVATKNENALNLYKSCGFEVTSTMDYYAITKEYNER
jgi:ribosomal protein S18 acetylase RimI-like enzyme